MKAAVFYECGSPEKIQIREVPQPKAQSDEVLVKVKACGLNYFDLLVLRGPAEEKAIFPFWGGADIAGIIAEVGKDVDQSRIGERVIVNPSLYCGRCEHCISGEESLCVQYGIIGDTVPGGFAEFVAVKEISIVTLPDKISFEEGAAVPLVFQTAWRALITQANIRPGEDVLILGASGGVGSASIQVAKLAGARVFAITSNSEKMAKVQKLGADFVLNRAGGDYWAELSQLTNGRGVDVVIENVGASTWKQSLSSLAKGGRLVSYARTTGSLGETDIKQLFWNQLRIIGTTMANRREFAAVIHLVFQGKLKPVIDQVFPLEQARFAYERLYAGNQFGKIIITMND
jgi:NADPH:quinone reductase-like Zn-dependent oxidoreductase